MSSPVCVVLDTNTLVSALVFAGGSMAAIRLAWQSARVVPLASRATIEELIRVLSYPKFRLSETDQQELLADYLPYCKSIVIPARPGNLPACRDPDDVMFLELAIAGKAKALVSGDKDLLAVDPRSKFEIVTPLTFTAWLSKK